jgi:hypothetical protein
MTEQDPIMYDDTARVAGELVPTEADASSESNDPATLLERIKSIDYQNHTAAIISLGAASLALGVGVYALSKRGNAKEFFVAFGDRRLEKKGVISLGERVEHGMAVALPISAEAFAQLKDKDLFSMDRTDGFGFPLTNPEDLEKYTNSVRRAGGWLVDRLTQLVNKSSTDTEE